MKRFNHQEINQHDPKRIKFSSSEQDDQVVITLIDLHQTTDENDLICDCFRKLTKQMDGLRLWTVNRMKVWDTIANPTLFLGVPIEFCRDPRTLERAWSGGLAFNLGAWLETNKETTLEMVKRFPKCFSVLRSKDENIILEALNTPRVVRYTDLDAIAEHLNSITDREYAKLLVSKYGKIFDYLIHFHNDEEMQLFAFKYGWYVHEIPEQWKDCMTDKSFVLELLKHNKNIIKHLPKSMLLDREILSSIFDSSDSIDNIEAIPNEILHKDKEFINLLLSKGYYFHLLKLNVFKYFENDLEFMKQAAKIDSNMFRLCPIELRSQKEFALSFKDSFKFISEQLKTDPDILLHAVKYDLSILPQLPKYILEDRDQLLNLIKTSESRSVTVAEFDYYKDDEEIWFELCTRDQDYISQTNFSNNIEFLLKVARKNPRIPLVIDFTKLPNRALFFREALKHSAAIFYYLKLFPHFFNLEEVNEITGLYLCKSSNFDLLFENVIHNKYGNCVLPLEALKFKPISDESDDSESEESDPIDSDYYESEQEDDSDFTSDAYDSDA